MLGILVWFLFLLPKNLPFCLGKYVNTGKCVYVGRETSRDERKKKKSRRIHWFIHFRIVKFYAGSFIVFLTRSAVDD